MGGESRQTQGGWPSSMYKVTGARERGTAPQPGKQFTHQHVDSDEYRANPEGRGGESRRSRQFSSGMP